MGTQHILPPTYGLHGFFSTATVLSSWDGDQMARKAETIYYLALYRNRVPVPP